MNPRQAALAEASQRELIVRACIRIALGLLALRAHDYPPVVMVLLSGIGWWLCVTGTGKLLLGGLLSWRHD